MIHAGQLRERVAFHEPTTERGARGEDIDTWAEVAKLPARVRQLSGRELERAQQIDTEATWEITTRYLESITSDLRAIVENGPTLAIVNVIDVDYRHRELRILAKQHS